ncbi:MAG TPA: hypothetical protein VGR47_12605 [Terracidiphilus sp.]|nr:hypothetical protein [Terracidiphilus sp.]
MNHSEKLSRSERADRIFPALMAFWFAFCLAGLYQDGLRQFGMTTTIDAAVGLFCCIAWLVSTPARLDKLELSRFWTVVLAAPFVVAVFALWKGWSAIFWVALLIAVVAQFVIYFLAPRNAVRPNQSTNGGEPVL